MFGVNKYDLEMTVGLASKELHEKYDPSNRFLKYKHLAGREGLETYKNQLNGESLDEVFKYAKRNPQFEESKDFLKLYKKHTRELSETREGVGNSKSDIVSEASTEEKKLKKEIKKESKKEVKKTKVNKTTIEKNKLEKGYTIKSGDILSQLTAGLNIKFNEKANLIYPGDILKIKGSEVVITRNGKNIIIGNLNSNNNDDLDGEKSDPKEPNKYLIGTTIDYRKSSPSPLGIGPNQEAGETITGKSKYNEFSEKLKGKISDPRIKMIFAISKIWIDGARKAATEDWSLMGLSEDKKIIETGIESVVGELNKIIQLINNKDGDLSEIDGIIVSIFTHINKVESEGEEIIEDISEIKQLFEGLNKNNYEEKLAKMLKFSSGGFGNGNTEKAKEVARDIIIAKYFKEAKNTIDDINDISSMSDSFFIGLTSEQSTEIVKEIKLTYNEVYTETIKNKKKIEDNFKKYNPDFEGNLTDEINKIISKTALMQSKKMAINKFIEYSTINMENDPIVDVFKDLNGWTQKTKEFFVDNGLMIAMSLIPIGAGFALVGAVSKGAMLMRGKALADMGKFGKIAGKSAKGAVFYSGMNTMNNMLHQDEFSTKILTGGFELKELIKSVLFFNIMGIVSKYVPAGNKILSPQTLKSISAEVALFTGVDMGVEFSLGEMTIEQFENALLTGGLMSIMSRGAAKINPSMRGGGFNKTKEIDKVPNKELYKYNKIGRKINGSIPTNGKLKNLEQVISKNEPTLSNIMKGATSSPVKFYKHKTTGKTYVKTLDGKFIGKDGKIRQVKEKNLEEIKVNNKVETSNDPIGKQEYSNFVNNGTVKETTLNNIAQKIKNNSSLSKNETAIHVNKTKEIEEILNKEFKSSKIELKKDGDIPTNGKLKNLKQTVNKTDTPNSKIQTQKEGKNIISEFEKLKFKESIIKDLNSKSKVTLVNKKGEELIITKEKTGQYTIGNDNKLLSKKELLSRIDDSFKIKRIEEMNNEIIMNIAKGKEIIIGKYYGLPFTGKIKILEGGDIIKNGKIIKDPKLKKEILENPEIRREIAMKSFNIDTLINSNVQGFTKEGMTILGELVKKSIWGKGHKTILGTSTVFAIINAMSQEGASRDELIKAALSGFIGTYAVMAGTGLIVLSGKAFKIGGGQLIEWGAKPLKHVWNKKWLYAGGAVAATSIGTFYYADNEEEFEQTLERTQNSQ